MKLNVTPAEMASFLEELEAFKVAPHQYPEAPWAWYLRERLGVDLARAHGAYQIVVRHDVLAIPCVGVERLEP